MLFNGDRMSCSLQTETNLNTRYLSGLSENQRMTVLLRFLLNTLKKMECVDQGLEYLEYIWVWVLLVVTGYTLAVLIRNIYIYISFIFFAISLSCFKTASQQGAPASADLCLEAYGEEEEEGVHCGSCMKG